MGNSKTVNAIRFSGAVVLACGVAVFYMYGFGGVSFGYVAAGFLACAVAHLIAYPLGFSGRFTLRLGGLSAAIAALLTVLVYLFNSGGADAGGSPSTLQIVAQTFFTLLVSSFVVGALLPSRRGD